MSAHAVYMRTITFLLLFFGSVRKLKFDSASLLLYERVFCFALYLLSIPVPAVMMSFRVRSSICTASKVYIIQYRVHMQNLLRIPYVRLCKAKRKEIPVKVCFCRLTNISRHNGIKWNYTYIGVGRPWTGERNELVLKRQPLLVAFMLLHAT